MHSTYFMLGECTEITSNYYYYYYYSINSIIKAEIKLTVVTLLLYKVVIITIVTTLWLGGVMVSALLSGNKRGQIVHTHVPLSLSSMIWCQ